MLQANHREPAPAAHNRRAGSHGSRIGARLRLDHRHDLARSAHPTSCRGRGIVETNQLDGLLDNLDEVSYRQALVAVREAALDPEIAWRLAYLIKPIARGDYSVVVDVLAEWLVDPDEQKVKACRVPKPRSGQAAAR